MIKRPSWTRVYFTRYSLLILLLISTTLLRSFYRPQLTQSQFDFMLVLKSVYRSMLLIRLYREDIWEWCWLTYTMTVSEWCMYGISPHSCLNYQSSWWWRLLFRIQQDQSTFNKIQERVLNLRSQRGRYFWIFFVLNYKGCCYSDFIVERWYKNNLLINIIQVKVLITLEL